MSIFRSQFACTVPWVAAVTTGEAMPGVSADAGGPDLAAAPPLADPPPLPVMDEAGDAGMHRSDTTDIGVGGDGGTFYLIDGDTSLIID